MERIEQIKNAILSRFGIINTEVDLNEKNEVLSVFDQYLKMNLKDTYFLNLLYDYKVIDVIKDTTRKSIFNKNLIANKYSVIFNIFDYEKVLIDVIYNKVLNYGVLDLPKELVKAIFYLGRNYDNINIKDKTFIKNLKVVDKYRRDINIKNIITIAKIIKIEDKKNDKVEYKVSNVNSELLYKLVLAQLGLYVSYDYEYLIIDFVNNKEEEFYKIRLVKVIGYRLINYNLQSIDKSVSGIYKTIYIPQILLEGSKPIEINNKKFHYLRRETIIRLMDLLI